MAAANESQGLKIAVAAFITLTVILTVTSYFLYSAYSSAEATAATANDEANKAKAAEHGAHAVSKKCRMQGRHARPRSTTQPRKRSTTHFKKIDERLDNLVNAVNAAVAEGPGARGAGPELEDAKEKVQQSRRLVPGRAEQDLHLVARPAHRADGEPVAALTTELSLNYVNLRQSLEACHQRRQDSRSTFRPRPPTTAGRPRGRAQEARRRAADPPDQGRPAPDRQRQEDHRDRQPDDARSSRWRKTTPARMRPLTLDHPRAARPGSSRKRPILDRPDGYVTYVDYERREVLVNINRRQGARPQMKMTIFDARSPGIPTEKPKGTIELTQVGDQFSIARIIKTNNPIDPIRVGDIVYSAAWSPNIRMRFALVGKIDVNRDGRDDREELKRMIQEAGGVVDFDLPPPDVGKETGKLSPRIDWYVTDERMPLREVYAGKGGREVCSKQTALAKRMGEVIKEARLDGIRPMPIERLLAFLGYDMNKPVLGRPKPSTPPPCGALTGRRD